MAYVLVHSDANPQRVERLTHTFALLKLPYGACGPVSIRRGQNGPRQGLEEVVAGISFGHQFLLQTGV